MSAELERLASFAPGHWPSASVIAALHRSLRLSHPTAELHQVHDADSGGLVVMAELSPPLVEVGGPRHGRDEASIVLDAVSEAYGVAVTDLVGRGRRAAVVPARQAAMALLRDVTELSYPAIARLFDGRDHTTVVHGVAASLRRGAASSEHAELADHARRLYHSHSGRLPGLEPPVGHRDGRPALRAVL